MVFDIFESLEENGLMFFLKEADEGLNSFALVVIMPYCGKLSGKIVLVQNQLLEYQRRPLQIQVGNYYGQCLLLKICLHPFRII